MDERMIFAVLGIERTKDEDAIRAAYRVRLPMTNPEDDPEGFKRLREAYEKALEYARMPETEEAEEQEDETPVGKWMQEVRGVYFSLPRRLDEEEWKRLLRADVCLDLEYGEEAKWRLFAFLADHYQLPSRIYQLLDETFGIAEEEEAFREHFPAEFVSFLLRRVQDTDGRMDFGYDQFRGAEDADYDSFINDYYELCEQTQTGDREAARRTVRAMEELGIRHPLFSLEKARTAQLFGEYEEAVSLVRPLIAEYKDHLRIQVLGAEIFYQCGLHEEARELLLPYAEERYYLVDKYLCFCEEEKGNAAGAIRHCLRALGSAQDEKLEEHLRQLDEKFIAEYAKRAEDGSLTDEEANCLVGCYNRANRPGDAMDFLDQYPDYADRMERLHEYRAILHFQMEQYEEGIRECRQWRTFLPEREELTGEERRGEEARSYVCEGDGFSRLAKQGAKDRYRMALEAYKTAETLEPDNLNIRQKVLDAMIGANDYEDAVKQADEMLAANGQWFMAYVQKQKACFELRRAQEVVDCFYAAKNIYAGYAQIYELASEVFIVYHQYGDAEHIFAQAKEAGVASPSLDSLRLRCLRFQEAAALDELKRQGRTGEFRLDKELTRLSQELVTKYKKEPAEAQDMYKLYQELGLVERDRRHFKEAARYFRKALRYEDQMDGHYLLANALFDSGSEEAALKEYHLYENAAGPDENLYINMARCYRSAGQKENAVAYFKKVLEVNDQNDEANGAIAKLYRELLVDSGNIYYGCLAKPYADGQLLLMPDDAYYMRERGLLLLDMNRFEEALAEFDRSLEAEKNPYGYNLKGKALYYMKCYEAAVDSYKLAINYMEADDRFAAPYLNAGDACRKMERFGDAADWYRRAMELFPKQSSSYEGLYWMYKINGDFQAARDVLDEQRKAGAIGQEDYEERALYIDILLGRESPDTCLERAKELAKRWDTIDAWEELAQYHRWLANDLQAALKAALTAYRKAEKENSLWENNSILIEVIECYSLLGEPEKAAVYLKKYRHELEMAYSYNKQTDAIEQYLGNLREGKENAHDLAVCLLGAGEANEAEKLLKRMQQTGMCLKCKKQGCPEAFELRGRLCEFRGETGAAAECYQKALEIDPSLMEPAYRLKRLRNLHTM